LRQGLLDNSDLQEYLGSLWIDFVEGLQADLDDPGSETRRRLGGLLSGLADELEKDAQMQIWVNAWLVDATVSLVDANRHSMASLISDTVRSWDAGDTSDRIEQAIGRDLQFIRINGTLVGGLVGLAIHAVKLATQ